MDQGTARSRPCRPRVTHICVTTQHLQTLSQACRAIPHLEEGRAEPVLVILCWLHVGPAFVLATGPLGHLPFMGLNCHLCLPIFLCIFQANSFGPWLSWVSCGHFPACTLLLVSIQVFVELFFGGAVPASAGEAQCAQGKGLGG